MAEKETEVKNTARIVRMTISAKDCQINIEDFKPDSKGVNQLARWVEQETAVIVTFNDNIATTTKLTKIMIQGKTVAPTLAGLKYASEQAVHLMQCVQSGASVSIAFKPDTEDLFQQQQDDDDAFNESENK